MTAVVLAFALLTPAQPGQQPPVPDVKEAVRTGLKWLADQQKDDGSWDGMNGASPTTLTAFAGLAFLMEGSTPKAGPYAPQLRKAVAWMEKNTQESVRIGGPIQFEANQYVPRHANALLFLACVSDVDDNTDRAKRLTKLIDKGIAFAVECQTSRGGWGLVSAKDGSDYDDGTTTVTVLQALFAARKAGFAVPKDATDKAVQYLIKSTNRDGGIIYSIFGDAVPQGNDGYPLNTAGAAAGLLMSDGVRPPTLPMWIKSAHTPSLQQIGGVRTNGSSALFQQFQMGRAAFALGETGHAKLDPEVREADRVKWSAYRAKLFKAMKATQSKNGSWPDPYFGPVYSTAMALVILQLDNDYLPAFSR